MKKSTEIASAARIVGFEKAVEYIAKAGFDAWDLSMFSMAGCDPRTRTAYAGNGPFSGDEYLVFVKRLKQIGLDNGIVCNHSHAPFPTMIKGMEKYIYRAIECTAEAGGKICVIHPDNNKTAEENAEFFIKILPFAKDLGVTIATENMWNWDKDKDCAAKAACSHHEDFLRHVKAVGDDSFAACLDIGHAEMRGLETSAVLMIRSLGKHLKALHIHDNDRWHDSHKIPFSDSIEFMPIVKALKDIGYSGYFTLEADTFLNAYDSGNVKIGIAELKSAAEKLANEFDAL